MSVTKEAASIAADELYRKGPGVDVKRYSEEDVERLITVATYMQQFKEPRELVAGQLHNFVRMIHGNPDGRISSRAKTRLAVSKKLRRRRTMRLAQVEDIAGCRVVLDTAADVATLLASILGCWPSAKVKNHVDDPRPTGYRALHVIVKQDGFPVEIQLRTVSQNRWADAVEQFADRYGLNNVGNSLKDGEAPAFIVRYFERAALKLATIEKGQSVGAKLENELADLRAEVRRFTHASRAVPSSR